jgi:hypothetical protein
MIAATTPRACAIEAGSDGRMPTSSRSASPKIACSTGNAADFTNLCGGVELHPGPITLPDCNLATPQRLLEVALSFVEVAAKRAKRSPRSFMLNRVVEVDVAGRCEHYELPTA